MRYFIIITLVAAPVILFAQKKVGIGTNSPTQRLSIDSTVNIDQGNFDDGNKPSLRFGDNSTGEAIGSNRLATGINSYGIDFWTGNAKRMVLSNLGNVGIGELSPGFPLNFSPVLGDKISFYGTSGNHYGIGLQDHLLQFHSENNTSDIAFGNGNSSSFTENVRFTGDGKVGIGITAPLAPLHIKSGSWVLSQMDGTDPVSVISLINATVANPTTGYVISRQNLVKAGFVVNSAGDVVMARAGTIGLVAAITIKPNGNVGIGTNAPSQRLSIDSTLNVDQGNYDDGTKPSLHFGNTTSGEAIGSRRTAGGTNPLGLDFWTNNTRRMVVSNNGNVGIATANPMAALSVNGDVLVDYNATNDGVTGYSLRFGNAGSGEGVSSARSGSTNVNGLNLFTAFTPRLSVTNAGLVGIGTTNPIAPLDVFDTQNGGFPASFTSNNTSSSIVEIQNNSPAANHPFIGVGLYRNGDPKGYMMIDALSSINLTTNGFPQLAVTTAGNVGIGLNNAGFPLNFAATFGNKISLYGNSGNNYGLGIQSSLMQLYTDAAMADIAFGYGNSTSFTENMRIKGNGNLQVKADAIIDVNGTNNGFASPGLRFGTASSGEAISSKRTSGGNQNGLDFYTDGAPRISVNNSGLVGINENNPGARLQITQPSGNYNNNENSSHALEMWDGNETLYMGADDVNNLSYIQAVGNSLLHTLALNARGGNVAIGKSTATERLDVNGNAVLSGNIVVQNNKGIVGIIQPHN